VLQYTEVLSSYSVDDIQPRTHMIMQVAYGDFCRRLHLRYARGQTNRYTKCKELVHTSKECNPNSFTSISKHIRNDVSGYSHIPKSHAYPMRYKLSKFTRRNNEERVSSVNLAMVDGREVYWSCLLSRVSAYFGTFLLGYI
jgi:hypothetical protein